MLAPGRRLLRKTSLSAVILIASPLLLAAQSTATTAWRDAGFHVNVPNVVGSSDIVLTRPNLTAAQALPLGNGRLGAAVWSADGMTVQLNRGDTLPYRLSPGQITVPGLAHLAAAPDYRGRLDLYDGAFVESGAGMSATVYVQPDSDTLIIDVTGADPSQLQTASLHLWQPRSPQAAAHGATGTLTEAWVDDRDPGASGQRFGSLAAITAVGRNVSTAVTDTRTVTVTVQPDATGSFRIVVGAPHYTGIGPLAALAGRALADRDSAEHRDWWRDFWQRAGLIHISSADGAGAYLENLRTIYLFSAAAEGRDRFPGSQAGVADLFSSARDAHRWDPAAYWHWNLRMQVAANLSAGLPDLNLPYFRLYLDNLAAIEQWTHDHMAGRPGACVPETMRFNGNGIEYETWTQPAGQPSGLNCDAASKPYYNARTISTGAEVSLWIWQQYLATGDRAFLAQNFPVMAAAARFLLAYEQPGSDGRNHTAPSNAHETQWDVTDPVTDIVARQALYAAVSAAAQTLSTEPALVEQLSAAAKKIPELARTQHSGVLTLLSSGADKDGDDVIANSYQPGAELRNVENLGLEPVWPYAVIGDTSPLFALAQRTYRFRPNKEVMDWSFDPIQAARLHLGDEVAASLIQLTEQYQSYINGFTQLTANGREPEFYVEQSGVVAAALAEALVQDYDGVIRIAPAVPHNWSVDGSVFVRDGVRVDVQFRDGAVVTAGFEVHNAQSMQIRNPWPGSTVRIVDAASRQTVPHTTEASTVRFSALAGHAYLLERTTQKPLPYAPVDAAPATHSRHLGKVQIGL